MKTAKDKNGNVVGMVIQKGRSCGKSLGMALVFGSFPSLPLRGFPEGKARIRSRNSEFAKVRIRNRDGIREFLVKEVDGFWEPAFETGFNLSNAKSRNASQ